MDVSLIYSVLYCVPALQQADHMLKSPTNSELEQAREPIHQAEEAPTNKMSL
jgi:hypothetical protein